MLSERTIDIIGWRIKGMVYGGETIYDWDSKARRLILPSPYLYWNWCFGLASGFGYCIMHAIHLYMNTYTKKHDLKDEAENIETNAEALTNFAQVVIEWGQTLVILVICLVALQLFRFRDEVMYLYNQMITYHYQVTEIMKSREIQMNDHHKKVIRTGEILFFAIGAGSLIFTCTMIVVLFHPLESNNVLMRDWFEFELSVENLKPIHIGLAPVAIAAINTAGNTVLTGGFLVMIYIQMATLSLADITPENILPDMKRDPKKFKVVETAYFGTMEDTEVINLYRTQQVFLVVLNKFMASVNISLQHVATLGCAAIMIYFAIKFNENLTESGILGYVVVMGSIACPFIIESYEAITLGRLVGISEGFVDAGKSMVQRNTVYYKFLASCVTFNVEEAYPFYHVDRSTFLDFSAQVIDYTITLLLW